MKQEFKKHERRIDPETGITYYSEHDLKMKKREYDRNGGKLVKTRKAIITKSNERTQPQASTESRVSDRKSKDFMKTVKRMITEIRAGEAMKEVHDIQREFNLPQRAYLTHRAFGVPGGARQLTPQEREAYRIAKEAITATDRKRNLAQFIA